MKLDVFDILKIVGLALIPLGHFILYRTSNIVLFALVMAAALTLMVIDERLFKDNKHESKSEEEDEEPDDWFYDIE